MNEVQKFLSITILATVFLTTPFIITFALGYHWLVGELYIPCDNDITELTTTHVGLRGIEWCAVFQSDCTIDCDTSGFYGPTEAVHFGLSDHAVNAAWSSGTLFLLSLVIALGNAGIAVAVIVQAVRKRPIHRLLIPASNVCSASTVICGAAGLMAFWWFAWYDYALMQVDKYQPPIQDGWATAIPTELGRSWWFMWLPYLVWSLVFVVSVSLSCRMVQREEAQGQERTPLSLN